MRASRRRSAPSMEGGVKSHPSPRRAADTRRHPGPPAICSAREFGYTVGMKTAISVPDQLFEQADKVSKRLGKSRSELYADALRAYLARHEPEAITAAMDAVCADVQDDSDVFMAAAARRVMERVQW